MTQTTECHLIQHDRFLKELCTFGIGGPARFYVEVHSSNEMREALNYCQAHQLRFFILGKGSNCLFDDRGFDGMVIHNKIDFIEYLKPTLIHVGAGYSFSLLGTQTARQGLGGLEFASGIPGTVGGAIFMNAGANGKETCEKLMSVDFMNKNGNIQTFKKEELPFSYRTSPFQTMDGAIISATFALNVSPTARATQLEIIAYRKKTQPYNQMSAGCVFRNPHCHHAGALIDKSGLKNSRIGDAEVSNIHANFIVNRNQASAKDVLALIEHIQSRVHESTGVALESEVRVIPYQIGLE